MAEVAVAFLLENLTKTLRGPVDLISGALSEIEELSKQVEELKAFLGDPSIQREERFRVLAREVREVVYGAQDISDSFLIQEMAEAAQKWMMNIIFLPNRLERRLSLAKELISFRKSKLTRMVHRVKAARIHMGIAHDRYGVTGEKQWAKVYQVPSISPNNIVGFEEEAATLINNLMEKTEGLDVISITGMPGIGKTTLAWKIYQNEKIQQEFPTRIWINVPQEFRRKDLYLHILKEFTKQDESYSLPDDQQDIAVQLIELLRSSKFLLVLENIWTVKAWNDIKDVLLMGNKIGKVLITSRNKDVCMYASRNASHRETHMLRFLNKKESWELLQLQVFGKLNTCPEWLKHIGERVADKCDGLPLAIEIIGSNLVVASSTETAMSLTVHWWEKVSENVTMYVTEYKQHGASGILELSYNILPEELRECFLYFGVFPEDYEVPTWVLTRLWIAEGFIRSMSHRSLEERAEEILNDLVGHNLVMVDKVYHNGKVKTCRVHKVIHGFCKFKALEQNLFQEIKMSEEGDFDPPVSLTPNYRRLCIHSHLLEYLSREPNGPGVRSFLCVLKENNIVLNPKHISSVYKTFKFLKVFESKSIKFTEFPINLTRLMNLHYISLCCDNLRVLPETISQLLCLQTLIVATHSPVLEVKANIWRMIRLRHLITKAGIILAIQGEGKAGGDLQTLSRLSPECCTEDVFKRACNLKKLGIRGKLATLLATDSLGKLDRLESLKLVNESLSAPASNNWLNRLHPNCFPSRLESLTLSATYFDWRHMLILGKVVTLRVLKLKNNAFSGDSWNTDASGFRDLVFLSIDSTDLVSWEASPHCFPRLRCLVLKNCEKLRKIPLSLAQSLQTLELENVSESAVESAREIEEEKVRMQGQQKGKLREFKLSVRP